MPRKVLVTGYIGGEVSGQLLARGHSVPTTVRSKASSEAKLHGAGPARASGSRGSGIENDLRLA